MGRWISLLAALGLVIGACGAGETANSAPSTTISSTTTTTVAPTTTTESPVEPCEPEPVDGNLPRVWEAGCVYNASSFAVPLTFTAPGAGWRSEGAADTWAEIRLDEDEDGAFDTSLTFIIYESDSAAPAAADALLAIEGVDLVTGPEDAVVGGHPAVVVDVFGQEDQQPDGTPDDPCSRPKGSANFRLGSGYVLFIDPSLPARVVFGIPACFATRAWVIDVGGTTITALGVAVDNDRFGELMPILEDFLQNSVTFGDADE